VALYALLLAALPAAAAPRSTSIKLTVSTGGQPTSSVASGTPVTLTATVLAGGTPVAPGQVNFCDATAAYCQDVHLLGTAQLTLAGTATLKLVPGIGSHSYTAVFLGTDCHASSTSNVSSLAVTGYALSSTSLTSTGNAGNYTLTGTLAAFGVPAPGGQLSFENQTSANALVATAALDSTTLAHGFAQPQSYGAGSTPRSIAAADFNGDGTLDLAVANEAGGSISVLLGRGDGTFAGAVNYAAGASPRSVAVGDFNSDGVPDLAVASSAEGTITVLLGNDDGTFAALPAIAAGGSPSSVAVGDFNHDGVPDLAVAIDAGGAGSVTILLGNGDGTFKIANRYFVGSSPQALAIADFNGDGALDLVTVNYGNVSVLLGNGDGTFQSDATHALASGNSSGAAGVAVGDFNGDGLPDIAAASSGVVSVLLNQGGGNFGLAAGYSVGAANSIAVADFNGDGRADLVVGDVEGRNLIVLAGKGDGAFANPVNYAAGDLPQAIAVGDFNGDGRADLAVAMSSGSAAVFLSEQTVTATATGISVLGAGTQDVSASHAGDENYSPSTSNPVALAGSGISTTLSVSSMPSSVKYGQSHHVVAAISPADAIGITAVEFTALLDGSKVLTLTASGGNLFQITGAALANLSVGSHMVTVNFAGSSVYLASSATVPLVVTAVLPTIIWSPPTSIAYGTSLSGILSATAQNGTVTVPGTFAYTATPSGGTPTPVIGATVLLPGTYTLTANFTPTDTTAYQSASASVSLTVGKAAPTAAVVSSSNSVLLTNPVTFTATVTSPTSTAPTGSLNFYDGQTLLTSVPLTQGGGAYTTASLALGAHTITVVYSGDANFSSATSPPLTQTVEDFTLSVLIPTGQPTSPTVLPGGTLNFTIQASTTLGSYFPSAVTFALSGVPGGATATLTPQSLAAGAGSTNVSLSIHLANKILSSMPGFPGEGRLALAMMGGMILLPFGVKVRRSARTWRRSLGIGLLLLAPALAAVGLTGCGASGTGYFAQKVQNYAVTVTATSGNLSHTTTVNFTLE
jgi:hypothetical protein